MIRRNPPPPAAPAIMYKVVGFVVCASDPDNVGWLSVSWDTKYMCVN